MKKIFTILTIVLLTVNCYAEENERSIITGCFSYHLDRDYGYNGNNVCFGYKQNDFMVLAYKNSENDPTLLLGHDLTLGKFLGMDAGFVWGVAIGYERYGVIPVLLPKLDYNITDSLLVKGTLIPFTEPAVAISFEYTF